MLSLNNTYNEEELKAFEQRIKKLIFSEKNKQVKIFNKL